MTGPGLVPPPTLRTWRRCRARRTLCGSIGRTPATQSALRHVLRYSPAARQRVAASTMSSSISCAAPRNLGRTGSRPGKVAVCAAPGRSRTPPMPLRARTYPAFTGSGTRDRSATGVVRTIATRWTVRATVWRVTCASAQITGVRRLRAARASMRCRGLAIHTSRTEPLEFRTLCTSVSRSSWPPHSAGRTF